nr:sensor histidine kinase [uncultured Agathobaculum sp.]
MWLLTGGRLRRALRRYRLDKNLEAVLHAGWRGAPDLQAFFHDIEERLHGEEITRLQQKQAEYLALQNQINPHFLYNALEAIRADALLADCEDIAETTEALATFFRYTISNVQEYVTFSDELDNAENYFIIQRCRFGDKLSMELEMENENLLEARMPKLILQPLVENAVLHGLEGKVGHGTVRIIVENSERTLFLRVRDDGVGMPEEQVEKLNELFAGNGAPPRAPQRGGIALRNVNSRIRLMFGADYGLHIFSAAGVGTECCATLPLLLQEE